MSSSFQEGRLLQLQTPLAEDELLPITFGGREIISTIFDFSLMMVSSTLNIDPKSVLSKPFSLTLYTGETQPLRYFHGLVSSFVGGVIDNQLRYYYAHLCPWFKFLSYQNNCRVFQNKNVPDIVEQIFKENSFSDYDFSNINRGQYQSRDYCLQYRESDYHFVQRLLEEEGIFYYFQHQQNKHILMLGDQNSAFKLMTPSAVQFDTGSGKDYCLSSWIRSNQMYSGKVTHQDYNYETADTSLLAQQSGSAQLYVAQQYETYHYPGGHDTTEVGNTRAQHRFEAQEAGYNVYEGSGSYPQFTVGGQFSFDNPPIAEDTGNYMLLAVYHQASDGSYLHGVSGQQSYTNIFYCIPAQVTYRPVQSVFKPLISSIQTALVVGASGQDIDTDEYGRVKVQFFWDRQGKKNDDSSCWVRVAQLWAGNQWGMHFMPRIGQEVVVQFVDGDPDRPLIVGCVYNESNKTPYDLPGSQTQSGIKTQSTGGGKDNYNELRFEDKQGSEEVFIQAQKDFTQVIKNNLTKNIGNDFNHNITNNAAVNVGKDFTHFTASNSTINVGQDSTQTIANNAVINVGNNLNQMSTNSVINVSNNYTHTIANNAETSVGNSFNQTIGSNSMVNIGTTGLLQAGESLTLRVGSSSIVINNEGLFFNGMQIKVNGS